MRIGIDFDNTLVSYGASFVRALYGERIEVAPPFAGATLFLVALGRELFPHG